MFFFFNNLGSSFVLGTYFNEKKNDRVPRERERKSGRLAGGEHCRPFEPGGRTRLPVIERERRLKLSICRREETCIPPAIEEMRGPSMTHDR